MRVRIKRINREFVAYACPRCLNGTMKWEQDKADGPSYLKCILCGAEVREEKFVKTEKKAQTGRKSEAKIPSRDGKIGENRGNKTAIKSHKWQFTTHKGAKNGN